MLKKFAGIPTVSAICAASAAQAHQVHYAMAVADPKPAMQPMPGNIFTRISHHGHGLRRVQAFDPPEAGRKA